MKIKSLLMFGFVCSQIIVGKAFASDSFMQTTLGEVVKSGSQIQGAIDMLTAKISSMKDSSGRNLDPNKISVQVCYFEVGDIPVFVSYHSKHGKDFSPNNCTDHRSSSGLLLPSPDASVSP